MPDLAYPRVTPVKSPTERFILVPSDAFHSILMYNAVMRTQKRERRTVRHSVSLPPAVARQVVEMASSKRMSANKVLLHLIEKGMESVHAERERFFELTDKLIKTKDLNEQNRIKEELARLTFGA